MNVVSTKLPGVKLIQPKANSDSRGFFVETFQRQRYEEALDQSLDFVQDNHSQSTRGVVRGLHFQIRRPQAKLVRVVRGEVFDVVVDVNPASRCFGQWIGTILNEENKQQLFVPAGFAHGFQVLSDIADFEYKCIGYYTPGDESGLIWNDPELAIDWPLSSAVVSAKDRSLPTLQQLKARP